MGITPMAPFGRSATWTVAVTDTSHVGMPRSAAKLLWCWPVMSTRMFVAVDEFAIETSTDGRR